MELFLRVVNAVACACSFETLLISADLPALKYSEHSAFLDLMILHPLENVVQGCYRLAQVWSLIEHHALRTFPHRGVGYLRARRQSFLGQTLEHLRRPHYGHVGRLAHPQDLLLDLRHPFIAAFHGQVTPRRFGKIAKARSGDPMRAQDVTTGSKSGG